jgi:hypothetical protein
LVVCKGASFITPAGRNKNSAAGNSKYLNKNKKMTYRFFSLLIFFTLLAMMQVGCSCSQLPPEPEGLPKLYPCNVSVTFGGKPLEGVQIVFVPEDAQSTWRPSGSTNKDGKMIPYTSFGYKGAPAGKYTVTFSLVVEPDDNSPPNTPATSMIPLKYSPSQSQEKVEVVAGRNNFDFELDAGEEVIARPR